ncbi:MAG: hypothetical protein JW910_12065 [Anaerolineae bacterium]|nr:hypothetical protein [Anaerolineae bacterium]
MRHLDRRQRVALLALVIYAFGIVTGEALLLLRLNHEVDVFFDEVIRGGSLGAQDLGPSRRLALGEALDDPGQRQDARIVIAGFAVSAAALVMGAGLGIASGMRPATRRARQAVILGVLVGLSMIPAMIFATFCTDDEVRFRWVLLLVSGSLAFLGVLVLVVIVIVHRGLWPQTRDLPPAGNDSTAP